jgi:hypothetical protein
VSNLEWAGKMAAELRGRISHSWTFGGVLASVMISVLKFTVNVKLRNCIG